MTTKKRAVFFLSAVFLSLISGGCLPAYWPKTETTDDKVLLTVNDDKITAKDVKKELALRAKQDPSFKNTPAALSQQLEIIINRRLLIQEAMRRKIAEEESFVNTIRSFWEQTLIRNLLSRMDQELLESVTVTEDEVNAYYSKLSQKVTFEIARNADKSVLEEFAETLKRGQSIPWNGKIGPAGYEEISSPVLEEAFSLGAGEAKIYSENGLYYLVRVTAKDPVEAPALNDIRKKIEERIKQRKRKASIDQWLKETRAKAKIHVFATQPPAAADVKK